MKTEEQRKKHAAYQRAWAAKNPSYVKKYQKEWQIKNRDKCRESARRYRNKHRETIREKGRILWIKNKKNLYAAHKKYIKDNRWISTFHSIKNRCENPNHPAYRWYGARGIKLLITKEELKMLWFRDKAYEMKCPSINRINPDGNYEFLNCEFIEKSNNKADRPNEIYKIGNESRRSVEPFLTHVRKMVLKINALETFYKRVGIKNYFNDDASTDKQGLDKI